MKEHIELLDESLLIFLNNLGSSQWDGFWLFVTNQFNLFPFFVFIAWLFYKKFGWKQLLLLLLIITVLITITDQFTNLVKNLTQRLRPCHEPALQALIRIVKSGGQYSFFSGHAANSMAFSVLIFCILKKQYNYFFFYFFISTYICLQPNLSWPSLPRRYFGWLFDWGYFWILSL